MPLIDYYDGRVVHVDGVGAVDEVHQRVLAAFVLADGRADTGTPSRLSVADRVSNGAGMAERGIQLKTRGELQAMRASGLVLARAIAAGRAAVRARRQHR